MVILKSKRKRFGGDLKIKLNGKRLHSTQSDKYLGLKICENLTYQHVLSIKLNRANTLSFKVRKFVDSNILRSLYFFISESYLSYCSLVWAHNNNAVNRLVILQKKAPKSINF